jgi:hypothetical protein
MANPNELSELREMCMLLFLELQAIRRRLDIEPFGLLDADSDRQAFDRDMKHCRDRLRQLGNWQRTSGAQ